MDFKRNSVIALYLAGKSQSAIVKALSHIKVNKMFVFRTIKRYKETGSTDKRHRGGKKKTATSREMVQKVKAQIEKNPSLSASQMANELQISVSSMIRILKNELNYKYQDAQSADVPDESEVYSEWILLRFSECNLLLRNE